MRCLTTSFSSGLIFKKILFIREKEQERERMHEGGVGAEGEGQTDSLLSREPMVGLDPSSLVS